ncbi:MAG: ferritin family protein [Candidatus Aminicenantes bacterium]|nr:ferritin family protein [Candidatus Aminicenantes bacterium]
MKDMNLSQYKLDDLLLAAIKSEIESRDVYARVAGRVKNAFLKERLEFLAAEEEKHRDALAKLFSQRFPGRDAVVPEKPVVPLPEIRFRDERVPLSDVLAQAMKAEQAAHDFYLQLADRFADDAEKRNLLLYFSMMEMGHYKLLDLEKSSLERLEEYGEEQELIHVGP